MHVRFARLGAAALGTVLLVGPLAGSASAHERRTVGNVQMVVGWLTEPAYAGFLNAVQLRVSDEAGPITDVGDGLKVEVTFGNQKVGPLPMQAAFGSPGEYRSPLVPTRPGTYAFRFVGTVKGTQVDQTFTSSPTTFDSPKETSEIEFPAKDPSRGELATRIERIDPRIDAARADAVAATNQAEDSADGARVLAIVGLIAGVAGLIVGFVGVLLARRALASRPGAPAAPAAAASANA